MGKIGFIGGGNMAEALIKGIIAAGVFRDSDILVSDIRAERLEFIARTYGVATFENNAELAREVEVLVLSVKPQNIKEVLDGIKQSVKPGILVISIAAGIKVAKIAAALGDLAIVRVMPNTPALVGAGASALYANKKARSALEKAKSIFHAVGEVVVVEDEDLIDAVTAVSGSGPAYYFLLMEEMIKAGRNLGLSEEIAARLVLQTAKGAALLAIEAAKTGESPAELRRKVTSPKGTTEAALKVFAEGNFGQIVSDGIKRARDRSIELSS